MKNILLILISMLCFYNISYSQLRFDYPVTNIEPAETIINYSLEYIYDSTNTDYVRYDEFMLLIGKQTSLFISKNFFIFDSLMRQINSVSQFQTFAQSPDRPQVKNQYRIYKNFPEGKMTTIDHVTGVGSFKFLEDMQLFNWKLENMTDTIGGIIVQKAICNFGGRNWIAWFADQIPINDGPYKFNGLPGIIVSVYDTKKHYVFQMLSIESEKTNSNIDLREKDFISSTKQDFFKAKDAFRDDIINRAKDAGMNNQMQQRVARSMKERNNPLELERD